jgi:alginate O-acetyltransferase complex protein AlgJ
VIDGGLAKAFEHHYEAQFPAKTLGVNLWAAIDYALFREGRPGVVIGTHDWLYTDEEFNVAEDYDASLRTNLMRIAEVQRELADAGVALVVALVPAKARIYPEYLSDRAPARPHVNLYDHALAALLAAGIATTDLRYTLSAGKDSQMTYLRTDTHWAPWGAGLAAREIANAVRIKGWLRSSTVAYVTRVSRVGLHRGDLFNFLPLDPYFERFLPPREAIQVMTTDAKTSNANRLSGEDLFGDSDLPQVVLVGTSYSANPLWNFAGALKEALGEEVASYAREGVGPFLPMTTYLQSRDFQDQPPRLVIWEIPERSLLASAASISAR